MKKPQNTVFRVYVEKKQGFDVESWHLTRDIRQNLNIQGLERARVIKRYDIQGIDEGQLAAALGTILSEPNADNVYIESMPETNGSVFAVSYLPGQYDQRADSAAQCVQLLTLGERPLVRCANIYAIEGGVSRDEINTIKGYLINPVDSCEAELAKPETLEADMPEAGDVPIEEGFTALSDEGCAEFAKDRSMAMSAQDVCFVRDYFKRTGRDPSETELKVIDTYWSDHCRHTTFLTELDGIEIGSEACVVKEAFDMYERAREFVYSGRDAKSRSLMDMATIGAKALKKNGLCADIDESEEINACSIKVTAYVDGKPEPWLVMFKNETHNHPTEIEPFGGAATCLGGAIRDPLSGRSYVYQAMRITGCADVTEPISNTLPGRLSQRKISTTASLGYSSYGNQIGLATGIVKEIYHPGYVAKHMELGAVIGAAPEANVVRQRPEPGDIVVLVGGRTGRDGCGGATGSSKAHDMSSLAECGAEVQKGNAPTERALARLFMRRDASQLIKRCNDFGAGGVCVAIGELAPGLKIDLDAVPKKYDGLTGTELAISESQERMAVVLAPENADAFIRFANEENLEATRVAVVTAEPVLAMDFKGKRIVELEREFLDTNGVTQHARAVISGADASAFFRAPGQNSLEHSWLENLKKLNVCGQRGLVERFDSSIGASTVLMPYGGAYAATETQAMCAKLPVSGETTTCTLMAHGYHPYLSEMSPFHGAVYAVLESAAKIAAAGGDALSARLTLQEFFERLESDPEKWGKPAAAMLGALWAQLSLGLPAIGGKDSMSGSFGDLGVPPTLVSFAVTAQSTGEIISPEFKKPGNMIGVIRMWRDETGLPDLQFARDVFARLKREIDDKNVVSAYVAGEGGYAAAISKMAFGNGIGARLDSRDDWFSPYIGDIIVECERDFDFLTILGRTDSQASILIEEQYGDEIKIPLDMAQEAWESTLEHVFETKAEPPEFFQIRTHSERSSFRSAVKTAKPRVFIPVFPGTNTERDAARAFISAGAEADVFIFNNLSAQSAQNSVREMARRIAASQILMLPGGFSGGDEPDGSGKFFATTLRNPYVAEAVMELLNKRDGLILGICNGFQALIKTGLVPYGEIRPLSPDDPTLTFNSIGRHVARYSHTRVVSVKSPWLMFSDVGQIHAVPLSHGEGRFAASADFARRLDESGQIATQYVNPDGVPSADMPYNPNGSVLAIEGITSPDGRVLGKMGHSERKGDMVGINAPGEKDQRIFEGGVAYFS